MSHNSVSGYKKVKLTYMSPSGAQKKKAIVIATDNVNLFETIIRKSFDIPFSIPIGICVNDESIYCPIGIVDLEELRIAEKVEVLTFPSTTETKHPSAVKETPIIENSKLNVIENDSHGSSNKVAESNVDELDRLLQIIVVADDTLNLKPSETTQPHTTEPKNHTTNSKLDRRRLNHGMPQRNSYYVTEKLVIMLMRDFGKSIEEITFATGVSKSNAEKWCTDNTRMKILGKYYGQLDADGINKVSALLLPSHDNVCHFDMAASKRDELYNFIRTLCRDLQRMIHQCSIKLPKLFVSELDSLNPPEFDIENTSEGLVDDCFAAAILTGFGSLKPCPTCCYADDDNDDGNSLALVCAECPHDCKSNCCDCNCCEVNQDKPCEGHREGDHSSHNKRQRVGV